MNTSTDTVVITSNQVFIFISSNRCRRPTRSEITSSTGLPITMTVCLPLTSHVEFFFKKNGVSRNDEIVQSTVVNWRLKKKIIIIAEIIH